MYGILLALVLLIGGPVAVAASGEDVAGLLQEAIKQHDAGDYPAAEKKLARVLDAEPENQVALYYMGMALYGQNRIAEAIDWLEKAAAGQQTIEGLGAFLAGLYIAEGQPGKALAYYEREYRSDSAREPIAYGYAWCLKGLGRPDEAKPIFRRLVDAGGGTADASRYELGAILVEEGAYVSATAQFKSIPADSPYAEAAAAYIESLAPFVRPLSFYGSLEYFYDDNPASSSSDQLGQQARVDSSPGAAITLMANTRRYEFAEDWAAKLQYLFYGLYYSNANASAYDFVSHSLDPGLRWHADRFLNLTLSASLRASWFGGQDYSSAAGGNLVGEWTGWFKRPVKMHAAYTRTRYTDAYESAGGVSSLAYLDADTWAIGVGTDLAFGKSSLNLDYTFSYENTLNKDDPVFGIWAADSRFRMHTLTSSLLWPLNNRLRGLFFIASANYSRRLHPAIQSGELYPSVAGQRLRIDLLMLSAKLQVSLWKKADVNLSLGVERTASNSAATVFDYVRNRYILQISAFY